MLSRLGLSLACVVSLCLIDVAGVAAQAEPEASAESFRFNQPIPVTIRKSNKAIVQMMLLGINKDGISVMTPQGKTFEYANNTFVSARSPDGSFFYAPAKDNVSELIERLKKLQPANSTPNGNLPGQPTAGPALPMATAPGAHNQPRFGTNNPIANGAGNPGNPSAFPFTFTTSPMPTAHSQSPTVTYPAATATSPMPTGPSESHAAMPTTPTSTFPSPMPTTMPSTMPTAPHMQTPIPTFPNIQNLNSSPSMTGQNIYVCSKCKGQNVINGAAQAGHRCQKCAAVWDQVIDEGGRVISSSPAAKVGGAVGIIVVVIGIVAAIVRKTQA